MSPSVNPEGFFETEREWQWIKHEIFADYANTWLTILGAYPRLHVVDAFAGRGGFDGADGELVDGSPVIFGQLIAGYNKRKSTSGKQCDLFCVEKNDSNFSALSERMSRFSDFTTLREGPYEDFVSEILDSTNEDPVLLLLDPIGLKAIRTQGVRPLIHRNAKTDVFLTLHFQVVHRVMGMLDSSGQAISGKPGAAENARNLDDFFGSERWRNIPNSGHSAEHREENLISIFFQDAVGDRYEFKNSYAVRARPGSPPKYWLAHLCDNEKGHLLMNDLIVKVDHQLRDKATGGADMLPGLSPGDQAMADVVEATKELLAEHPEGIQFGCLRKTLLGRFFGIAKQGVYSKAVKMLVKEGYCRRQDRPGATIPDHEVISLA